MNKLIISFAILFLQLASYAQNVGIGTNSPDSSALLELSSNNKGFLPPRMTTNEKNAIAHPANGLVIFNTTTNCLEMYVYNKWQNVFCGVADSTTNVDSTLLTDVDGNTYPTVKICNQTWMAKNLDVARYRNGDIIPQVSDPTEWANLTTGAWCWYNNDSVNGTIYGKLYNWYAVNDQRGLAPEGWHVASDAEWNQIVKCLDENADTSCLGCFQDSIAGGKLKSTDLWFSPNTGASNSSNFNALPGGFRYNSSTFEALGGLGQWWCSSPNFGFLQLYRYLSNFNGGVWRYTAERNYGHSIRCVKDTPITTLNDGLVAYYPFNGNANDESGNGNNGVVNGATLTTDRFGNSGKAYSFDGSNFINGSTDNFPSNNTQRSISIWYKSPNITNLGTVGTQLFGYGGGNCGTSFIGYFTNQNTFDIQGHCGNAAVSYPIQNLNNNIWSNLIITHDGVNTAVYLNGILINNTPNTYNTITQNKKFYFGIEVYPDGINPYLNDLNWSPFFGKLDDIRIYNRALSQEEITYLATH